MGIEPTTSCLLDRRSNQLSYSANYEVRKNCCLMIFFQLYHVIVFDVTSGVFHMSTLFVCTLVTTCKKSG